MNLENISKSKNFKKKVFRYNESNKKYLEVNYEELLISYGVMNYENLYTKEYRPNNKDTFINIYDYPKLLKLENYKNNQSHILSTIKNISKFESENYIGDIDLYYLLNNESNKVEYSETIYLQKDINKKVKTNVYYQSIFWYNFNFKGLQEYLFFNFHLIKYRSISSSQYYDKNYLDYWKNIIIPLSFDKGLYVYIYASETIFEKSLLKSKTHSYLNQILNLKDLYTNIRFVYRNYNSNKSSIKCFDIYNSFYSIIISLDKLEC